MENVLSLLITGSPHSSQSHYTALAFVDAVYRKQKEIESVFFYGDAVYVASKLCAYATDELDLTNAWVKASEEYGFSLDVCVTASVKRGILDSEEADREEKPAFNIHQGFQLNGLGRLIEAQATSRQLIEFKG